MGGRVLESARAGLETCCQGQLWARCGVRTPTVSLRGVCQAPSIPCGVQYHKAALHLMFQRHQQP